MAVINNLNQIYQWVRFLFETARNGQSIVMVHQFSGNDLLMKLIEIRKTSTIGTVTRVSPFNPEGRASYIISYHYHSQVKENLPVIERPETGVTPYKQKEKETEKPAEKPGVEPPKKTELIKGGIVT